MAMVDSKLASTIASALEVEPGAIDEATDHQTLEAWDSLGHIKIIMSVEEAFGVRFDMDEIPELVSVDRISSRLRELGAL